MTPSPNLSVLSSVGSWWRDGVSRDGLWRTSRNLLANLKQFIWESTPAQRRQRYGDAEYDWEHRVNTTSATVNWGERLLGHFHSPYQPTDPELFKEIMGSLEIDFREFTFIDIGSGKGRVLLMASDYPFRQIVGVELLPDLHRAARENISAYKNASQQCFEITALRADAREFHFPAEPVVVYLFNPLPESGLVKLVSNLEHSLKENPRAAFLLYHNPLLEHVLTNRPAFTKIAGTHQYSVFRALG